MATKTTKRKSTSAGPRRSGTLSATSDKASEKATTTATTSPTSAPAPVAETMSAPETKSPSIDQVKEDASPVTDTTTTEASKPETAADDDRLKRPDLIEAIANRVSLKRSEAKMVFDVVLDEIGKALDASDQVVLPPLGKLMVKKRMEKPGGAMLTVKLKRAEVDPTAGDLAPLADPDTDS